MVYLTKYFVMKKVGCKKQYPIEIFGFKEQNEDCHAMILAIKTFPTIW